MKASKIASILLISAVFLSACTTESYDQEIKAVKTQQVTSIESSNTITFSSSIKADKETMISAKTAGQITSINTQVGARVGAGATLAQVDGDHQSLQVAAAEKNYENAKTNLKYTQELMDSHISNAEISVQIAEKNQDASKTNLDNQEAINQAQIDDAKLSLEAAELNLSNIKTSFAQEKENLTKTLESTVIQAIIFNKTVMTYVYSINEQDINDSIFEIDSSFGNSMNTRNIARNKVRAFKNEVNNLEKLYEETIKDKDPTVEELETAKALAIETTNTAKDTIQIMHDILVSTNYSSATSQATLDQYKNQLAGFGSEAENLLLTQSSTGSLAGLEGIDQSFETLETSRQTQVSHAEKQIEIAKEKLRLLEETINASSDSNQSIYTISESQYEQSKSTLDTVEAEKNAQIQMAKTNVDAAKSQVDLAKVALSNTVVQSPYSGIIAEQYVDQGTIIQAGTPIFKLINTQSLTLEISVATSQISQFSTGQKAKVYIEGLENEKYEAKITKIYPAAAGNTNKNIIELELIESAELLIPGTFVKVEFEKQSGDQGMIIAIPTDSIITIYNQDFVYTVKDEKAFLQEIERGAVYEDKTEIISGLEIGNILILAGATSLREGDKVEIIDESEKQTDKDSEDNKESENDKKNDKENIKDTE